MGAACYVCVVIYYFANNFGAPMRIRATDKTSSLRTTDPAQNIDINKELDASSHAKVLTSPNLPSGGGEWGISRSAAEIAFAEQLKKASSGAEAPGQTSEVQGSAAVADSSAVTDRVTDVVKCRTNYGDLVIDVRESWAPLGTKQFVSLVDAGFFTDMPFYRVCPKYMTLVGKKFDYQRNLTVSGVGVIKDDPSLKGIRDMDFGYVFFSVRMQDRLCIICAHTHLLYTRYVW
jgi:hypothetical protein